MKASNCLHGGLVPKDPRRPSARRIRLAGELRLKSINSAETITTSVATRRSLHHRGYVDDSYSSCCGLAQVGLSVGQVVFRGPEDSLKSQGGSSGTRAWPRPSASRPAYGLPSRLRPLQPEIFARSVVMHAPGKASARTDVRRPGCRVQINQSRPRQITTPPFDIFESEESISTDPFDIFDESEESIPEAVARVDGGPGAARVSRVLGSRRHWPPDNLSER